MVLVVELFSDLPAGSAHERYRHDAAMDALVLR
nr:MAG TPA: hypothetical protein [Caudoviricetes sp.]